MGLALEVGYLADLLKNDEEGAQYFRGQLATLNKFLLSLNLTPHNEPEHCPVYSCDMFGYRGIHYLRRIAAHLDMRFTLPPPGDKTASQDSVLQEYYRAAEKQPHTFDHIILHSDAEGYYLPMEFESVLRTPDHLKIAGGILGSSLRLRDECIRLADKLELPLDLDAEAKFVWEAAASQGQGKLQWERYGIESYVCLRLYRAAEHSLKHGAAIVFC